MAGTGQPAARRIRQSATNGPDSGPDSENVVAAPFTIAAALLSAAEAAALEDQWADLAADAVEPNPFYAPALLLPALHCFADASVSIATVTDERGRLIALAPLAPQRGYSRLPVRYYSTWMHPHCFFAAPLIRRGREAAALGALFDLVEEQGAFFRLRHLHADGLLMAAARAAAMARGRRVALSARYERAVLNGGFDAEASLEAALKGKKRKELRRQRARLADLGELVFETLSADDDLDLWAHDFMMLELSGWKGAASGALASSPEGMAFFRSSLSRAQAAGSLDFHRLRLGSRTIASIINFIEHGAGYSFKIAYDEEFARFSPGVLLEIEMMRALEQRPDLAFVDSCAVRDHPMINALWRERRAIEALNISGKSMRSKILFRILTGLERASENWRARRQKRKDARTGGDDNADL